MFTSMLQEGGYDVFSICLKTHSSEEKLIKKICNTSLIEHSDLDVIGRSINLQDNRNRKHKNIPYSMIYHKKIAVQVPNPQCLILYKLVHEF